MRFFLILITLGSILLVIGLPQPLSSSEPLRPGDVAPNFYLKDLEGKSHFLNDYCGNKKSAFRKNEKNVVLLSFFASWCLPCREEYPLLEQLVQKYKDKKIKVFLINLKEEEPLVKQYVQDQQITLPVLLDRYGVASERFGVTTLPHLFLIDHEQKIVYQRSGFDKGEPMLPSLIQKTDSLLQLIPDKGN
ncbi:MAG: TlpA disulfide reductase family protein [Calditrichia bacterium]